MQVTSQRKRTHLHPMSIAASIYKNTRGVRKYSNDYLYFITSRVYIPFFPIAWRGDFHSIVPSESETYKCRKRAIKS